MKNIYFKKLLLILCLISLFSCSSKYDLEEPPLYDYELSSDEQVLSLAIKDYATELSIEYWEGALELHSTQPELVKHASWGAEYQSIIFVSGGWFTVQTTKEQINKLEIKLEKNESTSPRHMEIYVDFGNKNRSGKTTQKTGHGYHLFLHQAAGF